MSCPGEGFVDKSCNCMCPGSPIKRCDESSIVDEIVDEIVDIIHTGVYTVKKTASTIFDTVVDFVPKIF